MLKWLARKQLAAFERKWQYDTSYMREIVDGAGVDALGPMQGFQKAAAYRKNVPADVYAAAAIEAVRAADCGPCMQLGIRMAEAQGVRPDVLRAIVAGDRDAMSDDVRLAFDLARAVVTRDVRCGELSAQVKNRWGIAGAVSLAYGITAAQTFPTFKYALGHGQACLQVSVAGIPMRPHELQHA